MYWKSAICLLPLLYLLACRPDTIQDGPPIIMTVNGPIAPDSLGVILPHEHVLVDFAGAELTGAHRYHPDPVVAVAQPYLQDVHILGGRVFVDCTPAYLARDPLLLKRLSDSTGLHILTNTGYYGAEGGKYLPAHVLEEPAEQLAARWIAEWYIGIDHSGIRPGFIKISVNDSLTETDIKLLQAAALTHLSTGLTIGSHSPSGAIALEEIEILKSAGVDASAFIWIHAHLEKDTSFHHQAARLGAWVEFDGLGWDATEQHLTLVDGMKNAGFYDHVLVSHDAGWYTVGEAGGGDYVGHDVMFIEFLPALKEKGYTEAEIKMLTEDNPARAFTVKVREQQPAVSQGE